MAISLIETASLDTGLVAPSATTATTATSLTTASGSAPSYSARAWVNFNGTGTVAIRASGNVSSITDNGTGQYTVNFTTAMPDANYSVAIASLGAMTDIESQNNMVAGSIRIETRNTAGTFTDYAVNCVSIFR
jgi:hypothetical protein